MTVVNDWTTWGVHYLVTEYPTAVVVGLVLGSCFCFWFWFNLKHNTIELYRTLFFN